ncbi:MAG: hydrogenase nickel incorporation protein HypB [bacterium]
MEIKIVKRILAANDAVAEENRRAFSGAGVYVVNVMSSPGAGKTSLLERTLESLSGAARAAVIEGDIRTTMDAERLERFGVPIVQINTEPFGGECHLDAPMVRGALESLPLAELDVLFIENVGNLVCPAEFDVGADECVVVASVTEGEDKPLKYPLMFRVCDAVVINKTDLVEVLEFPLVRLRENIMTVNPAAEIFELSARTGDGVQTWTNHIRSGIKRKKTGDRSRPPENDRETG